VDKLLDGNLAYANETNDDLKLESQIFINSRVTLVKRNLPIMLMGLPKSCKRYGNGVLVVAANVKFYTTTLISSEGEEEQSISDVNLNRSMRRDLDKRDTTNVYNNLLNPNFI